MIRVERTDPPDEFEERVAEPGRNFLESCPNPTTKQFQTHNYWIRVKGQLHKKNSGICAYSCHYIATDTGSDTVEHFIPKKPNPSHAYVWENYRLVCGRLNGRKGMYQDVIDPFDVETGMFVLDFPSLLVKPSPNLSLVITQEVRQTILRLKLNDDESCVRARSEYVMFYCSEDISLNYLKSKAPFIAFELERQGLTETIRAIMGVN